VQKSWSQSFFHNVLSRIREEMFQSLQIIIIYGLLKFPLFLVDRIIYCNTIFTVFADKHLYFNIFYSLSGCWHLLLFVVIDAMLPQVKSLRTDVSECFCINFSFFKELLFLSCLPLSYHFYFFLFDISPASYSTTSCTIISQTAKIWAAVGQTRDLPNNATKRREPCTTL